MSLPNDSVLQTVVMRYIGAKPEFYVDSRAATHHALAQFPDLPRVETSEPFGTSSSHFANRVHWAVAHLKTEGWLEMAPVSGTGCWQFTAKARAHWNDAFPDADELIAEMTR